MRWNQRGSNSSGVRRAVSFRARSSLSCLTMRSRPCARFFFGNPGLPDIAASLCQKSLISFLWPKKESVIEGALRIACPVRIWTHR